MNLRSLCLLTALAASQALAQANLDIVPMPRECQLRNGAFAPERQNLYCADNRQCQIGAEEISAAIRDLQGEPGHILPIPNVARPGIYLLTRNETDKSALPQEVLDSINAKDPGPQGYTILIRENIAVIVGSDSVGALYGAYTFRQMLRGRPGAISVPLADICDWPDFRFRSQVEFRPARNAADLEKQKQLIDIWVRFKLNILHVNFYMNEDLRNYSDEEKKFLRASNEYAVERGFYPYFRRTTAVAFAPRDAELIKELNDYHNKDSYYSWTRDDLNLAIATRVMEFCRDTGFRMLFLHPIDGGAIFDPEMWMQRGEAAKRQWKDDERWKASARIFNIWAQERHRICPELILSAPFYPYSPYYADFEQWGGKISRELWRQNSIDYWEKMNQAVDPAWIPMTWMANRHYMDLYRKSWEGRAIWLYTHSFISTGIFGTWHRIAKTNYYGNPQDIYSLNGGMSTLGSTSWLNPICTGEFTWNTEAPGAGELEGTLYFDAETDFHGPPEIMQEWVPRASRALYGQELGNLLAPLFNTGIQPMYIDDPGYGMHLINKYRLTPLADTDPASQQANENNPHLKLDDSVERMQHQVKATGAALAPLQQALPLIRALDHARQEKLAFYYRRLPVWHLIAKARTACYQAREACKLGENQQAMTILKAALQEFQNDLSLAEKMNAEVKDLPDVRAFSLTRPERDALHGITTTPPLVKAMLEEELATAAIVLRPRRVGPVIKVGIYKGYGAKGTLEFFSDFKNLQAELIESLSLSNLVKYDCVFLMQTSSVSKEDVFGQLKDYIEKGGGGVVFQHDLCGYTRAPWGAMTPFAHNSPGIAKYKESRRVVVKQRHPVTANLRPGTELEHSYYDHLSPQPGPAGIVLAEDLDGDPVLVAGESGAGKVLFDGNVNILPDDSEAKLSDANAVFAQGAVEWITGVKLVRE